MSKLEAELNDRFGKKIKLAGLVKKTSVMYKMSLVAKRLTEYIDDRSKTDYPSNSEITGGEDEGYLTKLFEGDAVLREGEEMAPALDDSRVVAGGYLRDRMGTVQLSEADLQKMIDVWAELTRKRDKKGSHLVFSMDPRISAHYAKLGLSSHALLLSSTISSLNKYQAQFYPGQKMGYVAGFHGDRHHPHIHAMILPTLENGKDINLSHLAKKSDKRIDYQGYIKREFNRDAWNKYLEYALLPEARELSHERARVEPSRLGTTHLVTMAAAESIMAMSEEDLAGVPRRNYLSQSMELLKQQGHRDEILNEEYKEKRTTAEAQIDKELEKPDLPLHLEKLKGYLEDYGKTLEHGIKITSTIEERLQESFSAGYVAEPIDDELEANWNRFVDFEIGHGQALAELGSVYYANAQCIENGIMPHCLKHDRPDFVFPASDSEIEQTHYKGIHSRSKKIEQEMEIEPLEKLEDKILFTQKERTDCRKRVYKELEKQERILKGMPSVDPIYYDSDLLIENYDMGADFDLKSTIEKIPQFEPVTPRPTRDEIRTQLAEGFEVKKRDLPVSFNDSIDEF